MLIPTIKLVTTIIRMLTPKRRWVQFSLSTLFVVMTAICVWLSAHMRAVNRQRAAIAVVVCADGNCYYDYEFDGTGHLIDPPAEPAGPAWLLKLLGIDHLANIVALRLNARTPEDVELLRGLTHLRWCSFSGGSGTERVLGAIADLPKLESLEAFESDLDANGFKHISRMKELRYLNLGNSTFGDDGMAHLRSLTVLTYLCLEETPVGDEGLVHLEGLNSLRSLNLRQSNITDAGLVLLSGLTELRELMLGGANVGDAGLVHLTPLIELKDLELSGPRITDAGLSYIRMLSKLENLSVNGARVTDGGLIHIEHLNELQVLDLTNTQVTNAGLVHFHQMHNLRCLIPSYTRVTDDEATKLKNVLPTCRIVSSFWPVWPAPD
jgi:hypothetical protein